MLKPFRTIPLDGTAVSVLDKQVKRRHLSPPEPKEKSKERFDTSIEELNSFNKTQQNYYMPKNSLASPISRSTLLPQIYEESRCNSISNFYEPGSPSNSTLKNFNSAMKLNETLSSPKFLFKKREPKKSASLVQINRSSIPPVGIYDVEKGLNMIKKKRVIPIIFNQRKTDRLAPIPKRKLIPSTHEMKSYFFDPRMSGPIKSQVPKWEIELKKEMDEQINYKKFAVPFNESARKLVIQKSHFKK